jgi:MFS family permease
VGGGFILLSVLLVHVWVDETELSQRDMGPAPKRLIDREAFTREILALGVATFLMATAFSLITTLENEFNARLQQTALGFGIAFSALTFSRLLFQVPLGRLSDHIGRKPLIIMGLVVLAPATALMGYVASTLQLTGLRALQGLASAAIAAPAFALAGDLSKVGEGQQMSMLAMGFGVGIAVGPMLAGVLAIYAFELPFLVGGVLSLLGALIVRRYVPETVHSGAVP